MKFTRSILLVLPFALLISCSKEKRFKIDTEDPKDISACRATLKASGENGGSKKIEEKGFCYSTSGEPGLDDNRTVSTNGFVNLFEAEVLTLSANTHYFVKAYTKFTSGEVIFGDVVEFTTNGTYMVGDPGPARGIIFGTGLTTAGKYSEAAVLETSLPYGCSGTDISSATSITNGLTNSNAIVSNCNNYTTAASFCIIIKYNGKSGWYLPSSGELSTIFNFAKDHPGIFPKKTYWSSTQWDAATATAIDFNGSSSLGEHASKYSNYGVIAVRSFD